MYIHVHTRMHTSLFNREVSSCIHGCLFIQKTVQSRVHKEEGEERACFLSALATPHHININNTLATIRSISATYTVQALKPTILIMSLTCVLTCTHTSQQSQQAHTDKGWMHMHTCMHAQSHVLYGNRQNKDACTLRCVCGFLF